jgi:hypothetical protein
MSCNAENLMTGIGITIYICSHAYSLSTIYDDDDVCNVLVAQEDRLVPKECNERFEAKLRPEYERRGIGHKLVRRVIDGVRHDVTESMLQQTLECLAQEFPSGTSQVTSNVHPSNSSL